MPKRAPTPVSTIVEQLSPNPRQKGQTRRFHKTLFNRTLHSSFMPSWRIMLLVVTSSLSSCTEPTSIQNTNESVTGQSVPDDMLTSKTEGSDASRLSTTNDRTINSSPTESPAHAVHASVTDLADFTKWPRPQFTLFLTGRQHGYIEPCGCTGLTNQKGGLARRHSVLEQVRELGWPTVAMDIGNQVRRFGVQPQVKFQMTVNGLRQMKYDVVAFGPDDLRLSFGELLAAIVGEEGEPPFLSANVDILGVVPKFQIIETDGHKVGVTTVLGDSYLDRVASDELAIIPSLDALSTIWPKLEKASCDLYVLLAHASIQESQDLARNFPQFDVVVTAGGAGEPTYQPEQIDGSDAVLVQVGTKGMYAGILSVYDSADQPLRYQRVALDTRWPDSSQMLRLLAEYQHQLEALGLDGLQLRPASHPSGRTFVGSQKCGECHTTAHSIWTKTPHAHATQTLVQPIERYNVPRHYDPECLSCHVTGWNAQGYFPYKSGYLALEASRNLHGNGCENCHGPGSEHVAAEEGNLDISDEERLQIHKQMRLRLQDANNLCLGCHDIDNSPEFHIEGKFEEYWKKIEHYGKD